MPLCMIMEDAQPISSIVHLSLFEYLPIPDRLTTESREPTFPNFLGTELGLWFRSVVL